MKCITLKEFCNELGFYPNRERNLSDFAHIVGLSVSYISKLYNARMVGSSGPQWERLCKYVEQYGYQLINANPTDYMQSNFLKENDKLNKRITYLENYIKLLEFQLNDIQELVRISKRIANYENDKRNIKYKGDK